MIFKSQFDSGTVTLHSPNISATENRIIYGNGVVLRRCCGRLLIQRETGGERKQDETHNKLTLAKFIVKRMKVYKKSLSHNEKKTFPVVEKKIYILPHMVYDTLMCQNSVRRVKN